MMNNGLRGLVKTGIAVGAHYSRLDRVIASRRGLDRAPLVVSFHRVVKDFDQSARHTMPSMLVSTETLERQLDWIGERYRFVSMDEYAQRYDDLRSGRSADRTEKPMAVVTFDDGYRDVYENAFPLLQRKGIPFTVYVVTDLVGTDRLQLHDEVYLLVSAVLALDPASRSECWAAVIDGLGDADGRLAGLLREVDESADSYTGTRRLLHGLGADELRTMLAQLQTRVTLDEGQRQPFLSMDWDMLRELCASGVTVGSHTRSHVLLAMASAPVVREELEGSRQVLEAQLGVPVRHLAYPDGSFDDATLRAVEAAGYVTACTTSLHEAPDFPLLSIPRRGLWERSSVNSLGVFSPAVLSCQVSGVFDFMESGGHEH